ncbi:energy transducer TonB [Sphingomonas flavalba]|uniref:energy transducer TonB n=1 Tax=Sphingomonas flavalba TaxID=2559804 RepID=UPI0039E133C4
MAGDTALACGRRAAHDGWQPAAAVPVPPAPASAPARGQAAAIRYTDRPVPLSTRLVGIGGTTLVALTLTALALVRWYDAAVPVAPSTLSVFDIAPPAVPPAPDTAVPPAPEKEERREREMVEPVDIPPQLPVPAETSSVSTPIARPVPDPGPPAERSTAPDSAPQPAGARSSDAKPSWEGEVLAALNRVRRYPREAAFRRQQGVPWVRFVVDREGRVHAVRIDRPSGSEALDREALALPRRAQPLPRPPESVPGDRIELVVPVEFFMGDGAGGA